MSERDKDLQLGNIDQVPLDEEPVRRSRPEPSAARTPASSGRTGRSARPASPGRAPGAAGTGNGSGNGLWMAISGISLVLVLVMGAWFYRELSGVQQQLESRTSESKQTLGNLASKLSATDESLNQSAGKIQQRIAANEDQIRKLWDVSNKRNKDWIQDNKSAIASLRKQADTLDKSLTKLRGDLSGVRDDSDQLSTAVSQLQTQADVMTDSLQQNQKHLASAQKTLDEVNKVLPQLRALSKMQSEGKPLDKRLSDLESAIAAFDAYRRQLNTRLDQLEKGQPAR